VHGLTGARGLLGGDLPAYAVYAAADGHVALAALEPHFVRRLAAAVEVAPDELTREHLEQVFAARTAAEWERWAVERDIPLVAVLELGR
jgi:crotonobetainyl-CoA:carnitine CoA-transferase CaiB-like acyl-CoA transferase